MTSTARAPIPATLIPGDGIGAEIVEATVAVLAALGAPFVWETHAAGLAGVASFGDPLPDATLDSIRRTRLALKGPLATPSGGGIVIESSVTDQLIIFSVSDTGAGVLAEMRARIWEPFFTTRQRGTGLGLAIVRKRMEEAGGSARLAAATNGGGARFELRLPVAQVANLRERPTTS